MPAASVSLQNAGGNPAPERFYGIDQGRISNLRETLARDGKTIPQLAQEIGHPADVSLIQNILGGQRPCIRGKSHAIAVKLGIKDGTAQVTSND